MSIIEHNILFIDIETVPILHAFEELPSRLSALWEKKSQRINPSNLTLDELFVEKAGIYAEFGKIVVIGLGYLTKKEEDNGLTLKIKTIANQDEHVLLIEFSNLLKQFSNNNSLKLCAHNGKEFDYPFISRRLLINGIKLPEILNLQGKKPWEVAHLDTMEMWKFGDWKSYTSLELLAASLNVQSSKSDLDGSQVGRTYYETKDLDRIATYCGRDVEVTVKVYQKLINDKRDIEHTEFIT